MDILILPAFRVVFEVHGRGPAGGMKTPSIIAANHTSNLDPLFVLLTLPVRMRRLLAPAMGLNRFDARFSRFSKLENKARSGALKLLQAIGYGVVTFLFQTFPFPQGTAYRPSLEYTGELLDGGKWILIFPEGEVAPPGKPRSRDNPDRSGRRFEEAAASRPGRFRGGVARIAENTGAPVIPAAIGREGRRVTVSYGAPLRYAGEGYDAFAQKVQSAVNGMLGVRPVSP
jgi:1-acyl-sn-glycerol-3-phosphate acyltransferase